jgi:sugar phosphate isomerase/epimerase
VEVGFKGIQLRATAFDAYALREIGFNGWVIVELDRVVDPGGSPKRSTAANRDYVVRQLGLTL